jgi:hypothetical protein
MHHRLLSRLAALAVLAGVACASERRGETPPPDDDPVSTGSCTGTVPANASMCPGAEAGLTSDTPRVLKPGCTCDAECRPTPCSYACNAGFVLVNGVCDAASTASSIHVVDEGDGTVTVTDGFGARVWLRDANCTETVNGISRAAGPIPWSEAVSWSQGLASGACGLSDGSVAGDWRLPDEVELQLLAADLATAGESVRSVFTGIQSRGYWNSFSTCLGIYGVVEIATGHYTDETGTVPFNVWPVRTW